MRIGAVLVASSVLVVMIGGALLAATGPGGYKAVDHEAVPEGLARRLRYYYDEQIKWQGEQPLDWDCKVGTPDQVRYFRSGCASTFVADFAFNDFGGSVQLHTSEGGQFADPSATAISGTHALSAQEAERLRSLVLRRLPKLQPHTEGWSAMHSSTSAIEACIDGKSMIDISRNGASKEHEKLAEDILHESHLQLVRTSRLHCY